MNDQTKLLPDFHERLEGRIDAPFIGKARFLRNVLEIETVAQAMEVAKMMAISKQGVPKHLRNEPGMCLAVVMQAKEWEMAPYAVAKKSYVVNDQLAYESQLIHAVIEARAPLQGRLRCRYEGEGPTRKCIVSGKFMGETEPHEYETPMFRDIRVKNSPLWKDDPDQQQFYYASRSWARKWCPDVLLGVYAPDELEGLGRGARDVTPAELGFNPLGPAEDVANEQQSQDARSDAAGESSGSEATQTAPEAKSEPAAVLRGLVAKANASPGTFQMEGTVTAVKTSGRGSLYYQEALVFIANATDHDFLLAWWDGQRRPRIEAGMTAKQMQHLCDAYNAKIAQLKGGANE